MEQTIRQALVSFKATGSNADFVTVYNYCFPDFRYWYRHVQRYTKLDRQSLLSEFQYVVFRVMKGFDPSSPVPDGFIRYFRAATKKHSITLRRIKAGTPEHHSLRQDWEVVDPKSYTDREYIEIVDMVNVCLMEDEQAIVHLRLSGEQAHNIKKKMALSEFQYRSAISKIKGNPRFKRALSSFGT